EFELLFAVRDPADPAIEEIRRLAAEFPEKRIEVFITDREFGPNDKVNGLARLRAECRHEALVIDDSDIRVGPDYLRRVVAPLADPSVGLVTCLYRGVPGGGLPSLLKALWLSTDFQVGVMVGRLLGVPFALGATVVVRREQLDRADGFPALAPYLADDYRLGQAINELGARIVLSDYVVETVLTGESWRASWRHRIRWNKTVRACRPGGYFGLLLTFMVPLSLAALAVAPTWWPLAAAGLGLRLAAALAVGAGRLKDPLVPRYIFLLPAADFLSFALWLAGFFGRQVVWRGSRFQLEPSGRLKRIT
ncbi:MAG: bacteriohopanetetrol glucosamine biosynthesis glycosyltransferase HpnI, partial [Acidobacteria bacterium]|nr:bacteriohopanetetrol glucosamine biosynthesis glycosyltransferase HpnI [Acidobacteriota bacterium]